TEENPELRDAESRRNATRALIQLCEGYLSQGFDTESPLSTMRETQAERIFKALVNGTEDYATDNRGDVGSWVREECMKGMERWVRLLSSREHLHEFLTPSMMRDIVCALMKQACEKIDRVRDLA